MVLQKALSETEFHFLVLITCNTFQDAWKHGSNPGAVTGNFNTLELAVECISEYIPLLVEEGFTKFKLEIE